MIFGFDKRKDGRMQIKIDEMDAKLWLMLARNYRTDVQKREAKIPEAVFLRDAAMERVDKLIAKLRKAAGEEEAEVAGG